MKGLRGWKERKRGQTGVVVGTEHRRWDACVCVKMTWGCGLLLVLADVNRVMKYEMVKVDLLGSCFTSVFSARRMGTGLERGA